MARCGCIHVSRNFRAIKNEGKPAFQTTHRRQHKPRATRAGGALRARVLRTQALRASVLRTGVRQCFDNYVTLANRALGVRAG